MSGSYVDQRCGGRWGNKEKRPFDLAISPRMASLRQGDVDVLSSSFLPSTGGQGSEQRHFSSTVRQMGRILWGRPLCMIIIIKVEKNQDLKLKKHLAWKCQNWLFLVTVWLWLISVKIEVRGEKKGNKILGFIKEDTVSQSSYSPTEARVSTYQF